MADPASTPPPPLTPSGTSFISKPPTPSGAAFISTPTASSPEGNHAAQSESAKRLATRFAAPRFSALITAEAARPDSPLLGFPPDSRSTTLLAIPFDGADASSTDSARLPHRVESYASLQFHLPIGMMRRSQSRALDHASLSGGAGIATPHSKPVVSPANSQAHSSHRLRVARSEPYLASKPEFLLVSKEETEKRVLEEVESEEDIVEGRDHQSPQTGYSASHTPSAASTGDMNGDGFYDSPEAGSSRVYVGSNPILNITRDVVVDSVEAFDAAHYSSPILTPIPLEPPDEEWMEEAQAAVRELAVEDRMVWGVSRCLEVLDDCWSEFEDEEMGAGVCTMGGVPRMSVQAPYGAHDGNVATGHGCGDDHNRVQHSGLAPPSSWSLTSSIDEDKQTSLDDKPKRDKKRRTFVPFISGDKDKDKESNGSVDKENSTIGKKRSRLALFISRLSNGGSGSNSPSTRTPPTLSASYSTHALSTLFSVSSSSPALTPNFSATPSRSSSPTAPPDPPQVRPKVTIVADDESSDSSPSSSAQVDSATLPRLAIPPPKPFRRPLPPGIIIPPLPNYPPPSPPVPLSKAFSEGMIGVDIRVSPFSPCSNSTFGKHVKFSRPLLTPSSSSPRNEQASMTLPSALRRSVLKKSASASVLGLHQDLKSLPPLSPPDTATGSYFDDSLGPPTPISMASTEDYGELRGRDDFNGRGHVLQPNRPRLRAMASLGALPLNPGSSRSKGGFKGFVGRLTSRGRSSAKSSGQLHILPSFLGNSTKHWTIGDSDLPTPTEGDSQTTPTPKHSPSGSFSTNPGTGNASPISGGGLRFGLKSYFEKTSFRQT